ncbi:MAG: glycosyltransferase [bacterium]
MNSESHGPELSVIVPAFNAGESLLKCVKSIRDQEGVSKESIELIVVDDGSGDKSADAVEAVVDRLVKLEENQGAAAARNRGALEASADLLVFVDADVLLDSRALYNIRMAFSEDPSLDAAVGRYTEIPAVPGFLNAYHNAFTRYHHDLSPPEIDWFWGALGAIKKSAFQKAGGFDERYQGASAEDMELGKALYHFGCRIAYLPEVEGEHAHAFSLKSMLANDYKKAVLGTKLRLAGRLPSLAPGFAGKRNIATSLLASVLAVLLATGFFYPLAIVLALLVICALALINAPYYSCLLRTLGRGDLLLSIPLHWLQFIVILAGGVMGFIGFMLGRDTFGRPGWI